MKRPARVFARGVRKLARRVDDATSQWLQAPTVRNTHWLRTSLRRMDACLELLPKAARRTERARRYRKRCRKLFAALAPLRDADVMGEELGAVLDEHRHSSIERARPQAKQALAAKKPRLGDDAHDDAAIAARFAKVVARHGERLRRNLPLAVTDTTRVEELHDARKAAKRLRYAYELGGDDVLGRRLAWITALQDLLGDLHDRDVLIGTLSELPPSPKRRAALESAREARRAKHEELATWLRRTPTLVDVVAPAPLQLPTRAADDS